jgi:hypothetical protein
MLYLMGVIGICHFVCKEAEAEAMRISQPQLFVDITRAVLSGRDVYSGFRSPAPQ